ncbi:hypothetical protein GCM10027159_11120 [Lysobacter terrae]
MRLMRPAALAIGLLAALPVQHASAARLNYRVELSALHSDNLNLSEDNQAKESVFYPRLIFDFKEEGSTVEVQARGDMERRHYTGNRYDDETRAAFAGQLNWSIFPQRMNLVAEDYLSDEPINFRDGRYPGNLQRVNVFLVGPSFFARFSDATRLQVDLRGADTYAEVSRGFDSRRYSVAAALEHDLSPTAQVSVHVASTRIDLDDNTETVDYTRQDGYFRYDGNLRNIEYEIDLGHSRLNRNGADDVTSPLVRATAMWRINQQNRLGLRIRKQFADDVQDLVVRLSDPDETLVPDLVDPSSSRVTAGVYRQRDGEADFRHTGDRFGFRVRPYYRRLRYIEGLLDDRNESGVVSQVSYRLTPLTRVYLNASFRKRDFQNTDREDRDHVYTLGVEQQRTRHWGWSAQIYHNNRDSNQPDPVYQEKAVQVTVWWKR